MRVVPLLVLFLCGLSVSAAPDLSVAIEPQAPAAVAGDADYVALQQQADQALDILMQARERRLAALQIAVN